MRLAPESDAALLLMRCDSCGYEFRFNVGTFAGGVLVHMFPLSPDQLSALVCLFPGVIRADGRECCRGCGAAVDQTAWRKWAGMADEVTA